MAELDERLKSLDGDSLKKVLEAAGALLGKGDPLQQADGPDSGTASGEPDQTQSADRPTDSPNLPAPSAADTGTESGSSAGLNQLLDTLFSSAAQSGSSTADPSATADSGSVGTLASALPQLLQALSGKSNYIDEDRLNLVKAIKPYMAQTRAGSVDRAIKMANMAKAAKMALGLLGR